MDIKVGSIVTTDGRKFFEVVRLVSVAGIPTADMQRIRKDGVLFGGGREEITAKIHNRPLSFLSLAQLPKKRRIYDA